MTLPKFIADDSQVVTQELITAYEAMTGKTLYPAQVERLLIDLVAYRETLVRSAINDAARQNLVRFARAPMLDYLGDLVGVTRLPAQSARTTVRVTFAAALTAALAIPAGTRVEAASAIQFQTTTEILASVGVLYVDLAVTAVEAGGSGNGYMAGQVTTLVDELAVEVDTVTNLTVTSGGADEESDDRLRARIILAPEAFSVAGSRLAYRHHAMSAHQDIVDVAVLSPTPGVVQLYPLTINGLPSAGMLDAVAAICSDEKVRPLSDLVEVLPPVETSYTISARITVYRISDAAAVLAAAQAQASVYAATRASTLGQDVVPSQITTALSVSGVYQLELMSPSSVLSVPAHGWAHCTEIDVQLAGDNDG